MTEVIPRVRVDDEHDGAADVTTAQLGRGDLLLGALVMLVVAVLVTMASKVFWTPRACMVIGDIGSGGCARSGANTWGWRVCLVLTDIALFATSGFLVFKATTAQDKRDGRKG